MKELLKNLYPITQNFCFIEGDIDAILKVLLDWQKPLLEENHNLLDYSSVKDSLNNVFCTLLPLTSVETRRYLLVPTLNNWVLFLDNGHRGTDSLAPSVVANILKTKMIAVSHYLKTEETLFSYYDYSLDENGLIRSVGLLKENNWKLHSYGKLLEFEDKERFLLKRKKDIFNFDILIEYLKYFGIDLLDEEFYLSNSSILLRKIGPSFPATKEFHLKELL